MPMMPGKTALLELLKQEGVRIMFGNPGTTELPLMDALAAEHELALHPGVAGSAGDGHGGRLCPGIRPVRRGQPACRTRPRERDGHAVRRAEGRARRSW